MIKNGRFLGSFQFDHGLISLDELKNHLRLFYAKKPDVEIDDYNDDNYDNGEENDNIHSKGNSNDNNCNHNFSSYNNDE